MSTEASAPPRILSVPVEILLQIVQELKTDDLFPLRATCRIFRDFLDANADSLRWQYLHISYDPLFSIDEVANEKNSKMQTSSTCDEIVRILGSEKLIVFRRDDYIIMNSKHLRIDHKSQHNVMEFSQSKIGASEWFSSLATVPFTRFTIAFAHVVVDDALLKSLDGLIPFSAEIVFRLCTIKILTDFCRSGVSFIACMWCIEYDLGSIKTFDAKRLAIAAHAGLTMIEPVIRSLLRGPNLRRVFLNLVLTEIETFDALRNRPVLERFVTAANDDTLCEYAGVAEKLYVQCQPSLTTLGIRKYIEKLLVSPKVHGHEAKIRMNLKCSYPIHLEEDSAEIALNTPLTSLNPGLNDKGKFEFRNDCGDYAVAVDFEVDDSTIEWMRGTCLFTLRTIVVSP